MDTLTVVARFNLHQEAENARAVLASEGVDAVLTHQGGLRSDWINPESSGGIRLEVRDEDAERAREILSVVADGFDLGEIATIDAEAPKAPAPDQCARCGSVEFTKVPKVRIFALIVVLLAGVVAIGGRDFWPVMTLALLAAIVVYSLIGVFRCQRCGLQWS